MRSDLQPSPRNYATPGSPRCFEVETFSTERRDSVERQWTRCVAAPHHPHTVPRPCAVHAQATAQGLDAVQLDTPSRAQVMRKPSTGSIVTSPTAALHSLPLVSKTPGSDSVQVAGSGGFVMDNEVGV